MRNFLCLFKLQCLGFLGLNKSLHNKKSSPSVGLVKAFGIVILVAGLIVYFSYTYGGIFIRSMSSLGILTEVPAFIIALCAIVDFIFSFSETGTILYGYKDYLMISSMPVKTREIVLEKITFIYILDLVLNILVTVPAMVVFVDCGGTVDGWIITVIVVALLFSPMLSLACSIIIGALTTAFASLFRKKNIIQTIMYIIVLGAIFCISFIANKDVQGELIFTKTLERIYFIKPILSDAFTNKLSLVWFVLINVASMALVAYLVCITYKKFNTIVSTSRTVKNFHLKNKYRGRSEFTALFRKENARLLSLPIYLINCLVGLVFAVVGAVAIVSSSFSMPQNVLDFFQEFVVFFPAFFAFMFMLAPTTNCSISLEGNTFWLLRTSPVSIKKLLNVKLLVNVVYNVSASLICSVAICCALKLKVEIVIVCVATSVMISLLGGNIGLLANLLFPNFNWETPNQVVKQGVAVFITLIFAFAFTALFVVFANYVKLSSPFYVLLIIFGFTFIATIVTYIVIMTKGDALIRRKS